MLKEARMFFFEKKNQKTFVPWLSSRGKKPGVRWQERESKSFLLLFFKKEDLSSFPLLDFRPRREQRY
jgi:hypothetical protein